MLFKKRIENISISEFVIKKLELSDSLKTINLWQFENNKLLSLVIPNGIGRISSTAFISNNLEFISFPMSPRSIGRNSLINNNFEKIELPNDCDFVETGSVALFEINVSIFLSENSVIV